MFVHLLLDVCPRSAAFLWLHKLSTALYECTFAIFHNLTLC